VQDTFQIKFMGMPAHADAEAEVRAWLDKLAPLRASAGMTSGQIAIEAVFEHHRNRQGMHYQIQMQLGTAGNSIKVGSSDIGNVPHDDIFVAIRNGFRSVRRQLEGVEALRLQRDESIGTKSLDDSPGPSTAGVAPTPIADSSSESPGASKPL
jgi:hypothetical protein